MEKKLLQSFTTIVLITLTAGLFALPDSARAGSIVSWGSDWKGVVSDTPTETGFTAIAGGTGGYYSLALRADGSIVSWGSTGVPPTETGFTAIAGGGFHCLALRPDGSIVSWGNDTKGQVSNTPTESGFTAIAAGEKHSLALRADGSIVSWGQDSHGEVGNTPTESGFTTIASGYYHSMALRPDGSIVSWGSDGGGAVSETPEESGFTAIAGGHGHTIALRADGSIVSWGKDDFGQVSNTPTESGFTAIASGGGSHNLALRGDSSIVSWGFDDYNEVSNTPTESGFTAIAGGHNHCLAILGPSAPHFLNPIPAHGSTVHVSLDQLQWTLPEPNQPGDVVTCDVYFGTNLSIWENPIIVDEEAVESVSIGPLDPDTRYYWAIVLYDPSIPGIGAQAYYYFSPPFTFYAASNFPPIVDAGDDVESWLVDIDELIDGNIPPDAERVVQLNGIVTDDGLVEPYTVLWTVVSEPNSATNPAVIDPNNIEDPPITMTLPGLYELQLEAYDGEFTSSDTIAIQLYDTSCEHARNQEGFEWRAGDLNRDCEVDFVDFANFAADWLEEYYSTE